MSGKQSSGKLDERRILRYVTGLLYFYGAMDFENLYRAVADNLPGYLEQDPFRAVLDEEALELDSPYELCFDRDFYYRVEVNDADWVIKEQRARAAIPYRPVTEKEARFVVKKQYSSLWNLPGKRLFRLLQEKFYCAKEEAMEMILNWEEMIKNDVPATEAVQVFVDDLELHDFGEAQLLIDSLMGLANNTPLWILKGWTPHEVFERYEKPALKPLPAASFDFGVSGAEKIVEDEAGKKAGRKVGRNEPCPCGSGKKYKKCCGATAAEGKNIGSSSSEPASLEGLEPFAKPPVKQSPSVKPVPPAAKPPPAGPPTSAEWSALYEAAVAFKTAKCWEWMYNDDLFGVMDPETGMVAYCCVMGCLGEFFGLGAHLGGEGLQNVLKMLQDSDDEGAPEYYFNQKCLMASFENRNDLDKEDRAVIKSLGMKFRGKKQWPLFRSYEPGFFPWFINAWECRFLTLILQQVLETSLRCRDGKDFLDHAGLHALLIRVPREEGGTLQWADHYFEIEQFIQKHATVWISDELHLRKVLSSKKKGRGTWEIDTFCIPFPVQEEKDERPYYPKIFLILERATGLILRYEAVESLEEKGFLCIDAIVQLLEEGLVPSRIVVERDETFYLLEEACSQLKIPLEIVPFLKAVPEIREKMLSGEL